MANAPLPSADLFTHTDPAATGVSGEAMAANINRRYALIQNDSDNVVVWLHLSATAVANKGIRLNPAGGFYEMTQAAGNVYTGVVSCITAGGTAELLVTDGEAN